MESIVDGTWGSGPWPEEVVLADILLETRWTWREWNDTPVWIQRAVWDFVICRRRKQHEEHERAERETQQARRGR